MTAILPIASATGYGYHDPLVSGIKLYWDDTEGWVYATTVEEAHPPSSYAPLRFPGQLRIGENPSDLDQLDIDGSIYLKHTAEMNDDHAFEIDCDAAGFSDVKAIDIDYITGAVGSGEEEATILINIDETAAGGGDVSGLEVLATAGSLDKVTGLFVGAGIGPIEQLSGGFTDADSILDNAADVTAALANGGAGNVSVFEADNETMTFGCAAKFEELEFILDTGASGAGIQPLFEYSTGVGTWGTFGPVDGTNAMRNTGVIAWLDSDIPTWAVGTGSEFLIRITRQRNNLGTTPIVDEVQVSNATEFYWDKDGDVYGNTLKLVSTLTLENATQTHVLGVNAETAYIQGADAGEAAGLGIFTADGDGTDGIGVIVYAVGTPAALTNTERLVLSWSDAGSHFLIASAAAGSGTVRPLHLETGANTDQLVLNTDGSIKSAGALTVGGDLSVDGKMNLGATVASTIASGAITISGATHSVAPQTGTTDDLDTLTGDALDFCIIRGASSSNTITVKHATDNIRCNGGADITIDSPLDAILCWKIGSNWLAALVWNN